MKLLFTACLFFILQITCCAQKNLFKGNGKVGSETEKYFSFNPFGLAEPQMATGLGFGNHFTERSEYFTELSYISKTPFYATLPHDLNGYRLLLQYRYHFFEGFPGLNMLFKRLQRNDGNSFIAIEFRIKGYNFTSTNTFTKENPADTLQQYAYRAGAVSVGGAIVFGKSYNLSNDGNWKFEITAGIGGKQKFVKYKNVPAGYQSIIVNGGFGLKPPSIQEPVGMPYFPCTLRLKYIIN